MILDIQTLESWVDDITFKRAKQYYEGGYVEDLDIDIKDLPGNNKLMNISSSVISFNGFNSYEIEIKWDDITNNIQAYCSCHDNEEGYEDDGPCKHITAVLLKYIKEYESKLYKDNPQINEIDDLINNLRNASKEDSEYKRELNLEIKFFNGRSFEKPNIELKLGVEKNYVVKGMRKFLEAVLKGNSLEFGKNFTYDPSIHKFNEIDEKIMQMLLELRELDEEHGNSYGYYNPYGNSI